MEQTNMQRFKFSLPILKTSSIIVKNEDGTETEKRYIEGVASSTDLDLHGDRMDPSAIKSMADSLKYNIIKMNADHDTTWSAEIGDVEKLEVSEEYNLMLKAELNEMSKSKDLWYALTVQKKKLGLSIGGYVKEYENVKEEFKNEETGEIESKWVRHYKNIELDHVAVTASPANPKTWVSAIAKSIQEDSLKLIKTEENKQTEKTDVEKKDKKLRDLARDIVKRIQNMEADLLLELSYVALSHATDEQLLMIERNLPMTKKNVSLEADETVVEETTVDAEDKPEVQAETPAAPENESEEVVPEVTESEESSEEETTEEAKAETEEETKEETEEEVTEETTTEESGSEKTDEVDGEVDATVSEEAEATEEKAVDKSTETPKEDLNVKSEKDETAILLQSLTEGLKKAVESNEALLKRIEELESQPTGRKTVEIEKGVGDSETPVKDAKTLKAEMDEKIAELRKNKSNPNLFSDIQRVRAEYSRI